MSRRDCVFFRIVFIIGLNLVFMLNVYFGGKSSF